MKRPNLIIAGVRKAGTTSLFHYLRQHPQICPCRLKEPSYFIPLKYDREPRPLAEYLELFSHCEDEPCVMEASPGYFSGGAKIADAIAETLGTPRVVVILRNPCQTFGSNFNFLRSRLKLPKGTRMEEYLDRCEELHREGVDGLHEHRYYNSLHAGMYYRFLPAWSDAFGERLKILFFEDLATAPVATVKALCDWLELPSAPADSFDYSVENKTEQYRIGWLQHLALSANRRYKPILRRFHAIKKGLRTAYYLANRDPAGNQSMSPECHERLQALYAEPNLRLAGQLRQMGYDRLPAWLTAADALSGQASLA